MNKTGKIVQVVAMLGYSDLFELGTKMDGTLGDKYSVKLIFSKQDTVTINAIKAGCAAAIQAKFGDKGPPSPFTFDKSPLRDGDAVNKAGRVYKDMQGKYFITARSKFKPQVVRISEEGGQRQVVPIDPDDVYTGMTVCVKVSPYVYTKGTGGVAFSFQAVSKIREGKRMSGGYWEYSKDEETGKPIRGKFVEGGGRKEETFDNVPTFQEPDVQSDFKGDTTGASSSYPNGIE